MAVHRRLTAALVATVALCFAFDARAATRGDWPNVGYDKGGTRFSPLDQINRENVG